MLIYKCTNLINNKCYIGQTIRKLNKRINRHIHSKNNSYFHKALKKYDKDEFKWEILCECETKEELDEMEFHYIKQYHTREYEWGYNLTDGGEGSVGYIHTEKTRKKLSDYNIENGIFKGENNYCYKKYGHDHPWYGNHHTEKTKKIISQKLSELLKGTNKGSDNPRYGDHRSWEKLHGKEKSDRLKKDMSKRNKGKNNPNSKSYKIISPNNEQFITECLNDFCKEYKLNRSMMGRVGRNEIHNWKGWKCEKIK